MSSPQKQEWEFLVCRDCGEVFPKHARGCLFVTGVGSLPPGEQYEPVTVVPKSSRDRMEEALRGLVELVESLTDAPMSADEFNQRLDGAREALASVSDEGERP